MITIFLIMVFSIGLRNWKDGIKLVENMVHSSLMGITCSILYYCLISQSIFFALLFLVAIYFLTFEWSWIWLLMKQLSKGDKKK